jgi:hypothetical protein
MKRLVLVAAFASVLTSSSGCCLLDRIFCCRNTSCPYGDGGSCGGCSSCAGGRGYAGGGRAMPPGCDVASAESNAMYAGGAPTGQTAYPYYTTRGPRDFLASNPPSIGP